jgi:dephospho-CoA kinase
LPDVRAPNIIRSVKVIGLTGGIGSGKSTVARFLEEMGAVTVDLDSVGHEVLKQAQIRKRLAGEFGREILAAGDEIDRTRLGRLVFNNPEALARLNAIVHPAIDRKVRRLLEGYRRQGERIVVLEAAAMLEAGRGGDFDELWVAAAPEDVALARLAARTGLSREEALTRLRSQLTDEERVRQADVVIDTDCTLDQLKESVAAEWRKLLERL